MIFLVAKAKSSLCCVLALLLAVATWSVRAAHAQDAANLHGTVTDASGAVVPGAEVTATSVGTHAQRATQTSEQGFYTLAQLPPGQYDITVGRSGFETSARNDLNVTVGENAVLNFVLSLGSVQQTVTVNSGQELLATSSSSLSEVVQGRQVVDMPLNGRNVLNLVTLVPGVMPQGDSQGSPVGDQNGGFTTPGGFGNYQIGGGFAGQSVIFIDGAPENMLLQNNYVAVDPTQDAIQEFRVETNNPSAEFGGFNGGVINMTTKSGSNDVHGTVYEYLRNRVLNANNFFNNREGVKTPAFTQNQYGAAVGAPIRKDHTFVFFSWENFSVRQGVPLVLTVPTPLMRTGNFSEICTTGFSNGVCNPASSGSTQSALQIYDPCGGTVTVGGSGCSGYTGPRTPFAGNIIPEGRLDPTAVVMLNYWALPNLSGYVNNYAVNASNAGNSTQYNGRIDHKLTNKQQIFFRNTYWHVTNPGVDPFQNGTGQPRQDNVSIQPVVGYTYALNPTSLLSARLSWTDLHYYLIDNNNINEAQFGPAWAALAQQMEFHILPDPSFISGGYTTGYQLGSRNFQEHNFEDATGIVSFTKVQGLHTIQFGGEYTTGKRFPALNVFNGSGQFSFNNAFTSSSLQNQATSGYGLSSFLLGYPANGSIGKNQPVEHVLAAQGYYITDTFQASKSLTLNLGLRWDQPGAIHEAHNLDTVFLGDEADPLGTIYNPVLGTQQQLKGQLALVASSQYPSRNERQLDWGLFSPRVGFAFRASGRDEVRGGFGISFIRTIGTDVGPRQSPINAATTTMVTSLDGGLTPDATLSNPFPGVTLLSPTGRNQTALYALEEGQGILATVPNQPWGYIEQWNLSLQHQFGQNAVAQAGYAATSGIHLPRNGLTPQVFEGVNIDQLPDQYDAMGPALTTSVANPLYGRLPASAGALAAATVPAGQLLLPYPQFQYVSSAQTMAGRSIYNSLEASYRQRFGAGGTFLAAYTWSKFIDNTDSLSSIYLDPQLGFPQDFYNLAADRSLSSFDAPQRLVLSYVLDLPFGKGQRWLAGSGGFVRRLVSGWSGNGITTFQSGYPLAITAQPTVLSSDFGAGIPRPNIVPGCSKRISGAAQQRIAQWFNTACFTEPSPYGFGNESRTDPSIRGAGISNWDFGLIKVTPITERLKLQFNAEVFNLFNRVQFGLPGNQLGSPNFGVVSAQANQPRLIQFALRLTF